MSVLAHIGNIPVEEWLPFVAPVVVLYLIGRRRSRHRRREVQQLPEAAALLDERTTARVVAEWAKGRHEGAAARHVALMYPPGPDGLGAAELASRTGQDVAAVERLLAELHELGYAELDGPPGPEQEVSLTLEGYDLLDVAESVLLEAARERESAVEAAPGAA
jgi:IclR helix-turn-helix domain